MIFKLTILICFIISLGNSSDSTNQIVNEYANKIIRLSGKWSQPYSIGNENLGLGLFNNKLPNIMAKESEAAASKFKFGRLEYGFGLLTMIGGLITFQIMSLKFKTITDTNGKKYRVQDTDNIPNTIWIPLVTTIIGGGFSFHGMHNMSKSISIYNNAVDKNYGVSFNFKI